MIDMGELEKKVMIFSVTFEPMPTGNIRLTVYDQPLPASGFTQTPQGPVPQTAFSKFPYTQPTQIILRDSEFNQLGRPTVSDEITIKLTMNKR